MAAHDPSTSIRAVFATSRFIGAYPTTRKAMGYAVVNLSLCALAVSTIVVHNEISVASRPSSDITSTILEHLESVEASLMFFMNLAVVMAYAKYDMSSVVRSIYHVHDCIFKLGIVPAYSGKRGPILMIVSAIHILTEYSLLVESSLDEREIYMLVVHLVCALSDLIICAYITQFCSLMELLHCQMKALISGLTHENHWYLESVINVQCHVVQTAKDVYTMYVRMISMAIAHSTISMMTCSYEVTIELNYFKIAMIASELFVILNIVDACGQFEFKVADFNSRLFKLMRLSKGLCENNKLYVFLTSKQTITFTACGFFTVNYPLIVSIIAAVTTYLVILVQLSKPQQAIKFE